MRFLLAISLVLMAFLLYGCAGNPQAPAQVPSAAPQAPPQKTTQPGSGNQQGTESAAQIELQDSKYSTDCMMAASKAYKSRNYQAGIDNCTIAINSIKVLKTKALPYRFRADLKEKSGDLDAAYADYTLSIAANPDDPVGYESRACISYLLGKTSEAKADIDKGHALNPRLTPSDKYKFDYLCNLGS